ncbi:ABC transporter ATP-binding protein [Desulfospira joergensenii]|uniref:ABC transporter ATP-binding protein n=1 Tax=Desulfospira joergensenii TaxID=53329 RepID=UPI0003B3F4DD|nr:ABC transporter ATP-binding protein [Desulfospira joergensenii]
MNSTVHEERVIRLADTALARAVWPFIRPFAWMLALSTLLALAAVSLELAIPAMIQKALDGFILSPGPGTGTDLAGIKIPSFQTFALIFSGIVVAGFAISFVQTLFMEYTGQKIILNLRCALFSHMTRLPVSYFDENASGRLVSRVAGDIENMNEMFTTVLVFMVKDLVLMAGVLVMLFLLDPGLTLFLSWILPVLLVTVILFSRTARRAFRNIRQKIGEINHQFSEGINGIKVIQTIPAVETFVRRFERLNLAHFRAAMFQIRIFALFMPLIGFLGTALTAAILWKGSFFTADQSMSLGELVAFLTYVKLFFRPLRDLSEKFNLLQNALASAERIVTVLNRPKTGAPAGSSKPIQEIESLEFKGIDFSYKPGTPVLKDISFSLAPGQALGIAGQTGSGKTSIINLITGFYGPGAGEILFNGTDLARLDITEIRARTALVMQDPILFSGTIRENICPWGADLQDSDLESALEKAGCRFLFEKFQGLDTRLMEGGRPLSSGEKQLVCIARAFAFDPDLIIFDEATSYMDSQSEQAIHNAMEKLLQGRLSILIAHRLSTIRNCDKIILLRNGRIREQGSHKELTDLGGEYFHLLQGEKI